jgi:hypothetical protein
MANGFVHRVSARTTLLGAGAIILGVLLGSSFLGLPTEARDLNQKGIFFERSPRLIRSATSFRGPAIWSNYYFTIEIPQEAGAPLKTVTIIQQPNLEQIVFDPSRTRASLGDSSSNDQAISLTAVASDSPPKHGVKVIFERPIEPGQTVTIALKGINPLHGGIYQFGVTAFPGGDDSQGLYLGVGRLQFSQPGGRP